MADWVRHRRFRRDLRTRCFLEAKPEAPWGDRFRFCLTGHEGFAPSGPRLARPSPDDRERQWYAFELPYRHRRARCGPFITKCKTRRA